MLEQQRGKLLTLTSKRKALQSGVCEGFVEIDGPQAQYSIGMMLLHGDAVSADPGLAQIWLARAAEAGSADAQYALAELIREEQPVESLRWMECAARQGHQVAMNGAALQLLDPSMAPQERARGEALLRSAADQGLPLAQCNLAKLLMAGELVERDPEGAIRWFEKAAAFDDADAQYCLAVAHLRGDGVEVNRPLALAWLRKAAEGGHEEALGRIADLVESSPRAFDRSHLGPLARFVELVKLRRRRTDLLLMASVLIFSLFFVSHAHLVSPDLSSLAQWRQLLEQRRDPLTLPLRLDFPKLRAEFVRSARSGYFNEQLGIPAAGLAWNEGRVLHLVLTAPYAAAPSDLAAGTLEAGLASARSGSCATIGDRLFYGGLLLLFDGVELHSYRSAAGESWSVHTLSTGRTAFYRRHSELHSESRWSDLLSAIADALSGSYPSGV